MDYEDSLAPNRLYPESLNFLRLVHPPDMTNAYPPVVIEGLLRQGEILLAGGPPKRWKSWARLDMLYCIANGLDWLGFKCHKGLVVHVDLELFEADIVFRLKEIQKSYQAEGQEGNFDNFLCSPLRGQPFTLDDLAKIPQALANQHIILFSLDPVYRLLAEARLSENDQADVSQAMNKFLALASNLNCAVALLQHFSKGNQAQKDAQDRFSGSGVWSRYPDVGITFTDHKDENCVAAEFFVRSFQNAKNFVLRWDFPRFRIVPDLDPEELKAPKHPAGRPQKVSVDQLAALLSNGDAIPYKEFLTRAKKIFDISEASFNRKLKNAKDAGIIFLSPLNQGYALTPSYVSNSQHSQ